MRLAGLSTMSLFGDIDAHLFISVMDGVLEVTSCGTKNGTLMH